MGSRFSRKTCPRRYRTAVNITELSIQSDGVTLVGTKVIPDDPKAIVLLVHGSGQLDRNQNSPTARLDTFSYLASALADAGFASVRWDKRGVGASGGDYQALRQAQLVADVRAWIKLAEPAGPIYLLGHSEGTAIATEAAQGQDIAGLILLCPYITPGGEILIRQASHADAAIDALTGFRGWLARRISGFLGRPSQIQARIVQKLKNTKTATIRVGLRKIPALWLRDFVNADLGSIHRSNQRPSLIMVAEHDAQCPPEDGAKIAALNPTAELVTVTGLSHILRPAENKDLADYPRQLSLSNDPRVGEIVSNWLIQQTRGQEYMT